ncbi:hypothetical protein F4782DRAFT_539275 [Xylaria castorea]|nr:hypothetical protein F4782DRAFT_539275 [Xylaria castorea]
MKKISKLFMQGKQKESRATFETVPLFLYGVKVWINPPDATIDVCFVHGLTGDRDATWTAPGHSEPWPSVLLPAGLPKARLLTYGYDAYVVRKSVASINTFNDHAINLLRNLANDRELCNASSRRIIFVAHSLGGLICKEAILQSRNNPETRLCEIFHSVVGILFMGTPHTGSWIADWAKIPARTLGVLKSTNRTLLEVLKTDSQLLQSIQSRFLSMVRELRENKRPFEASATFEGYPLQSIHANHSDMVKFGSAEDNGFKRLSGDLIRWAKLPSSNQVASTTAHIETVKNCAALPYYQECLRSLSFPQMDDRFKDIDYATKGTCEWLSRHEEYKRWAACDRSLLWIKGKPGSGKSTLLQSALRDARKNIGGGPLILSFFFHGRGVELQKTTLGFYRSLLHQLLCRVPDTLSNLVTAFKNQRTNKGETNIDWQWHPRELLDFLKSSLSTILGNGSVWLYVDALDECGKKNAIDLVRDFKALLQESPSTNSQFHICFTCRHYPILDLDYGFEISLDHENRKDISTYVHNQISAHLAPTIPVTIPNTIIRRASGVFLWTRLVIERIFDLGREGTGWKEIEAEIKIIPDDLGDLYRDIVGGMDKKLSLKLIQWICFAARPLSLVELQWAMAIDAKCTHRSLQECQSEILDDDSMKRRIQTLSCGLAEIVPSSGGESHAEEVVQFIHQSVKDFFAEKGLLTLDSVSKSRESAIANAHYQLSRTCIRYFAMEEVDQSKHWKKNDLMLKFPFLHYATKSWVWHEQEIKEGTASQEDLLDYLAWPSEKLIKLWTQLYKKVDWQHFRHFPTEGTRIEHIASYYQLVGPLQVLLLRPDQERLKLIQKIDVAKHRYHGRPIMAIKLLLIQKITVIEHRYLMQPKMAITKLYKFCLIRATLRSTQQIIMAEHRYLTQSKMVEVDSTDTSGRTPLSYAAAKRRQAIVHLLQKHRIAVVASPSKIVT